MTGANQLSRRIDESSGRRPFNDMRVERLFSGIPRAVARINNMTSDLIVLQDERCSLNGVTS